MNPIQPSKYRGLHRVISGGQTGADQGGLMAAFQLGVMTGGTAPANYQTSRGPNPLLNAFGLAAAGSLSSRTTVNARDSDGTVVLSFDLSSPGTVQTVNEVRRLGRPLLVIDTNELCTSFGTSRDLPVPLVLESSNTLYRFIREEQVRILNVAGNRERHEDQRQFYVCKTIVLEALKFLDLDDLLIRDTDL